MQKHFLDQASHNANFRKCLNEQFEKQFFDWKITVVFYEAIHYLKALAAMKGIDIGQTHVDISKNTNPSYHCKMPLSQEAYRRYTTMLNYSKAARYNGITDYTTFELLLAEDYRDAVTNLEFFKKYIHGNGCHIDGVVLSPRP